MSSRQKWDRIYAQQNAMPPPNPLLQKYAFLFADNAVTLDLACGLGSNSLYLAQMGYQVTGWDISPVALQKLTIEADKLGVNIETACLDITAASFNEQRFDLIIVNHFLDRNLALPIVKALNPKGMLFFQTFVQTSSPSNKQKGPSNPQYRLDQGELLSLFSELNPRVFLDMGSSGDANHGLQDESLLIAVKN
jgi:2-polyprenyl-3-methyl-5-hydroxy-6-metoxy-1,4-benzoquinol methylase